MTAHARPTLPTASVMLGLLALLVLAPAVSAQSAERLDAAAAQTIIRACADHALQNGRSHAIAVVDGGGWLLALLRMDGNGPGIGEFAVQKAEAVAHWGFSTAGMEEAVSSTPGFARAPRVVTVGGGVGIRAPGGRGLIGAVGVSGEAPEHDAACAAAGIEAAGFVPVGD